MAQETDLESLCKQCGLCCHIKAGLRDGTFVVHPTVVCKFQNADGTCAIYAERFALNPDCKSLREMIAQDYVLPEGCPYTLLRPGYKGAKVVSGDEFDKITLEEILQGNFNIVKILDDIHRNPEATHKIIGGETG